MLYSWLLNKLGQSLAMDIWYLVFAFLCMVIPYLLGSINPAIILSNRVYKDDVRTHGSGNAGSTNMMRTYGTKAAVVTFLCDMLKTVISVVVGLFLIGPIGMSIAGFFVVFGHMFPIWYKFKGGKGVVCCVTVALIISPWTALCAIGVFVIVLIGTKMVSMASVMAAFLYPIFMHAFSPRFPLAVAMAVIEAVFIVFMHRENLKRIWNYEERKVDFSKLKSKLMGKGRSASNDENGGDGNA